MGSGWKTRMGILKSVYEYQPIPGAPFSHHQQFISRYSDKKLMQPFAAGHQCGLKAGALG